MFTDAGASGRVMADGSARRHASHTITRGHVWEGSHGCPSHVLSPFRRHCLVKRFVFPVSFGQEAISKNWTCFNRCMNKSNEFGNQIFIYYITNVVEISAQANPITANLINVRITENKFDIKTSTSYIKEYENNEQHKSTKNHQYDQTPQNSHRLYTRGNVRNRCIQTATNCSGNC